MIKALIRIRIKQIYRGLQGTGLIRFIFIIGLFGFAGFALLKGCADNSNAYYITIGNVIVFSLIQIRRKDKLFLKTHFSTYRFIFFIEYLLLSLPILLSLLYHQKLEHISILTIGNLIIPFFDYKPRIRSLNTKLQELIPRDSYEWKAGSRKVLFVLLLVWIIGFSTSFFIGSVPVAILILGFVILSFYESCEPYQMIIASEKSSSKFLLHKIKSQTLIFTFITLPLIIAFVLFNAEYWYIVVIEHFLLTTLHIFIILTKYAYYEPNTKSSAAQTIGGIGVLGTLIPVFIPVVWIMTVVFYYRSKENLNYYLNDFH
jgi:hypothetical protein